MKLVEISVPVPTLPNLLTYCVPQHLEQLCMRGVRVFVPVGHREIIGVVVNDGDIKAPNNIKLREIISVIDNGPIISNKLLELCIFVAGYYYAQLGETLKLCLPAPPSPLSHSDPLTSTHFLSSPRRRRTRPNTTILDSRLRENDVSRILTDEQSTAISTIINTTGSQAFLLEGITGSGKTEVYTQVAKHIRDEGKGVLILVPEISLTPQLSAHFEAALNTEIIMLHSGISPKKKTQSLLALQNGQAKVALGARSAIFAPIQNLGLIVVDEEHDQSLKQDEKSPRYHARDVALWRARNEGAKIILGSATPSLESRLNAEKGKLIHLKLTTRFGNNGQLPTIQIVDLKARAKHKTTKKSDHAKSQGQPLCILSGPLRDELEKVLQRGEQAMIFLNRRGYSTFALCDACGEIIHCKYCSVSLTYYQKANLLRCHQCNHFQPLPKACTACTDGAILTLGLGTERVQSELEAAFPHAKVARLDRDVATTPKKIHSILQNMRDRKIDILIGTQMIAKGHDFPAVSLVGVVLADVGLAMPDFRAAERTFQILTQVAGRAGRAETTGNVIIQTFNPTHPSIAFAQNSNVDGFAKKEMGERKRGFVPPFSHAVLLRVDGKNAENVIEFAQRIRGMIKPAVNTTRILGPAPAPIEQLRGKTRHQIFILANNRNTRTDIINSVLKDPTLAVNMKQKSCRLIIDVDPISLM